MLILYRSYARSAIPQDRVNRKYAPPGGNKMWPGEPSTSHTGKAKIAYLPKLCTAAVSLSYTSKTVMSLVTCSTSLNLAPRLQSLSVPPCDRAL